MTSEKTSALWARAFFYAGLGSIIPVSAAAGFLGGWYLDRALNTAPAFALVGGIAGTATAITEVVQIVTRTEKKAAQENDTDGEPKS
jgi:F0F1-type ATP synthase assembly protein I